MDEEFGLILWRLSWDEGVWNVAEGSMMKNPAVSCKKERRDQNQWWNLGLKNMETFTRQCRPKTATLVKQLKLWYHGEGGTEFRYYRWIVDWGMQHCQHCQYCGWPSSHTLQQCMEKYWELQARIPKHERLSNKINWEKEHEPIGKLAPYLYHIMFPIIFPMLLLSKLVTL